METYRSFSRKLTIVSTCIKTHVEYNLVQPRGYLNNISSITIPRYHFIKPCNKKATRFRCFERLLFGVLKDFCSVF